MPTASRFGPGDRIDLPDEEITTLYQQGVSIAALARQYGVARKTIRVRLERQGEQIRGVTESLWRVNRDRAFPSPTPGTPSPLPALGETQRQISVRFPEAEWEAIAEEAIRDRHVHKGGRPILGLAIRALVTEAITDRRQRRATGETKAPSSPRHAQGATPQHAGEQHQ